MSDTETPDFEDRLRSFASPAFPSLREGQELVLAKLRGGVRVRSRRRSSLWQLSRLPTGNPLLPTTQFDNDRVGRRFGVEVHLRETILEQ